MDNNENMTRSQLRKKQEQEQKLSKESTHLRDEFDVDGSRSKKQKKGSKVDRILNKIIIVLLLLIVILCIFIFNV